MVHLLVWLCRKECGVSDLKMFTEWTLSRYYLQSVGRDFGYVFDKLMSTVSTLFGNVLNCIIVVLLTFKNDRIFWFTCVWQLCFSVTEVKLSWASVWQALALRCCRSCRCPLLQDERRKREGALNWANKRKKRTTTKSFNSDTENHLNFIETAKCRLFLRNSCHFLSTSLSAEQTNTVRGQKQIIKENANYTFSTR